MFIPTESTNGGHITANYEHLWPTFTNLDQSEEKALRAELAHQKLLNAHMALQTKMEEYQHKQQQTIDDLTEKLKVSIEQLWLKHQEHEEKDILRFEC
uniref:Takusan domain-containing protein n=1 Tax=Globodera pallida TaxID=36090 RepID=A0A183BRG7_GLOPA